MEPTYSKLTVEGDKKTNWICGCFETVDNFFKFCSIHNDMLKNIIEHKIDELDTEYSKPTN